ncbi:hypothetical protein cypCar_00020690 [Cyprinus carpio]|nr:hypothetical protein cypCar_00020690 [Cyprinus carpio]
MGPELASREKEVVWAGYQPPKDGKSAKNKGGNISKAERERLQREADEQRRREEEEACVIAEREEDEGLERERIEQEKQEQLELKDRERREDELNELRYILDENHSAVTAWESECRDKAKWEHYMHCNSSPDPSVHPEINSFISLWREDSETQIQQVLENCALALQLTNELDFLLSEGPDHSVAQQYREALLCLQSLIHCKLNQATEELLKARAMLRSPYEAHFCLNTNQMFVLLSIQSASSHSDFETGNMQTVVQDENITLCLWVNLNKNPRFKGFRFEEVGLGFELPKPLAVIDVAVQILHTRYDHLSHHSERQQLQRRRSMMEAVLTPPTESIAAVQDEKMEGERDEGGSSKPVEEDSRMVRSDSRKRVREALIMSSDNLSLDQNGSDSSPAEPVIDRADVHIVDLQQFTPLGGVYYFDVLHLPPQSSHSEGLGNERGQHWWADCISEASYDAETHSISFKMNAFYAFTLLQESYSHGS